MKNIFFKYLLWLHFALTISIVGCQDKNSMEDIPLVYSVCPCDRDRNPQNTFAKDNIILFDASKTSFDQMKELAYDKKSQGYRFVYINLKNIAIEHFEHVNWRIGGEICNFPVDMVKPKIPSSGIRISYEGVFYEPCDNDHAVIPENIFSDIVLTSLKIQKR